MTDDDDAFEAGWKAGYERARKDLARKELDADEPEQPDAPEQPEEPAGKKGELTFADVKQMSEAEINRSWPEVQRVLSNAGKTG